jgi:dihydrodipicolinate synthase/N-acetylneuraminate lyase
MIMKYPPFTQDKLHGIWTALPVPWKKNGSLDRATYATDIARCCKAGVHGLYSGGTTGEFYVQDFKLFREINELLTHTSHEHGTPIQAGCTALDTAEACKRVSFARKIGADIIQIALPFWLELDDAEVMDFFVAVARAAGRIPIVHYDTGRSKRRISPSLYQQIRKRVPTLWGTKFGGSDVWSVKQITQANPGLKVFVGEHILASSTPMGATGSYSSVVMVNPSWILGYYEACRSGDWEHAFRVQDEIAILFQGFDEFVTPNLQDTAIDRMLGRLAGFVKCPIEAKPPYRHGTAEDLRRLRNWTKKNLPHILQLS